MEGRRGPVHHLCLAAVTTADAGDGAAGTDPLPWDNTGRGDGPHPPFPCPYSASLPSGWMVGPFGRGRVTREGRKRGDGE